ncbi:MAG TPA: PadR family transcriptional regulator [Mycobacteriales bacterium]|nr:PadR family transcriptional regulator [Mycobacteriales bacterium]
MRRTATTGNAILGLLALRPSWSTWEITQQLRRNMRFFWPRAESRIYDEARALVDRGLASSSVTHTGRRPKTTYNITAAGRRHLKKWHATQPRPTTLECEPVLRILLGRLAEPESLFESVAQVRRDALDIIAVGRVVAAEYAAGTAPFQDDVAYRSLVFDFLSSHATAMLDWADRADIALSEMSSQSTEEAVVAGQRRVAAAAARLQVGNGHDAWT